MRQTFTFLKIVSFCEICLCCQLLLWKPTTKIDAKRAIFPAIHAAKCQKVKGDVCRQSTEKDCCKAPFVCEASVCKTVEPGKPSIFLICPLGRGTARFARVVVFTATVPAVACDCWQQVIIPSVSESMSATWVHHGSREKAIKKPRALLVTAGASRDHISCS